MTERLDTIVVGAGVSGLAYAQARGPNANLVVLEASSRAGGLVHTDRGGPSGQYRFERGPEALRYEKGELRDASATSPSGKALGDADARALAQRDATADDAFVASLLAIVAANPPRCDHAGDKA